MVECDETHPVRRVIREECRTWVWVAVLTAGYIGGKAWLV